MSTCPAPSGICLFFLVTKKKCLGTLKNKVRSNRIVFVFVFVSYSYSYSYSVKMAKKHRIFEHYSNPPIILPSFPSSLSHWLPTSLIDSLTPTPPQTTPPFAIPLHSTSLYSTLIHSTPYHFPLLSFVVLGPSIICIPFLRRILTVLKKANRLLVRPRHSGLLRCFCGHYCYIIGSMFPGIQAKTEVVILGPSTSLHKISG